MSQQCTPLWSPELYSLGVLPMWAAWVLRLTNMGGLIGVAGF